MKVRMLRNAAASYAVQLTEGQEGDVSAEEGVKLVTAGIAVEVASKPASKDAGQNKPQQPIKGA